VTITSVLQRNVRLFIVRSFILSVYTGIYEVIFNLYILDMGFHEGFLGTMLAINMLTASMASVPAGILCDRFNKRKLMLAFSHAVIHLHGAAVPHELAGRAAALQRAGRIVRVRGLRVRHPPRSRRTASGTRSAYSA